MQEAVYTIQLPQIIKVVSIINNTVGKDVIIGGTMWNQELQQLVLMIKL